ncbi:MAG: hypothetical protein ABR585_12840 [Gemmatimonadaceae bacterium]|nr:hypothetical protein [Actinomycetota bacterium]
MTQHTNPTLDALDELVEVFVGLSNELEWATSEDIYRKEFLPLLKMCAAHSLSPEQTLDVICANMIAKRDETFRVMLGITQRLNKQLAEYNLVRKAQADSPHPVGGDNGEETV